MKPPLDADVVFLVRRLQSILTEGATRRLRIEGMGAMKTVRNIVILGVIGAGLLVGCATEAGDDSDSAEADVVPAQENDIFGQVKVCDNLFKDRATFRKVDLD